MLVKMAHEIYKEMISNTLSQKQIEITQSNIKKFDGISLQSWGVEKASATLNESESLGFVFTYGIWLIY
jgi:hypothetical protein